MYNSLTNVSPKDMKIQNLVSKNVKSVTNISSCKLLSITVNKIAYMTLRDKFVTEMISNVVMLTGLNENVSKIKINFVERKMSIFYWRKM